jgi:hypothetical protein
MAGAKKDQTASVTSKKTGQTFKYSYVNMESIVEAIRGPFAEHSLSFTQLPVYSGENEVRVETVLLHSSGQWISSEVRIPVDVADAHGFGSAFTYACKYGLRAIAGVPAVDDDDGAAAVSAAKPRPTEAQMMPKPAFVGPETAPDQPAWGSRTPKPTTAPAQGSRLGAEGAPHARMTTFQIAKANYSTAGMTEQQMRLSFDLVPQVDRKLGKDACREMLKTEFGVVSRSDLTEEAAEKFLIRLQEILND